MPTKSDPEVSLESLTPREEDVLHLLAKGMTNKAIALQLGITDHTVKYHVNAIMGKLNAQSRTDAVMIAMRAGLIVL
jgi:two-component system nitrate/nitrite response regulator NarL